jgi:hypothetical protein
MDLNRLTDPQAYKDALAGLLRRGTEVGEYIQEAPTKVGQSILDAGQRQSALMNKAFDPTGNTLIRDKESANQAAMNLFEGPMSFAPAGITAFHGTPHLFDKFDMKKVGTGEGAQAYGHGMYFAENPNVAKGYQDSTTVKFKGSQASELPESAWDELGTVMQKHNIAGDMVAGVDEPKMVRMMLNKYADKLAPQEKQIFEKYASAPEGNLYKVDIPDEYIPKMLDYDKPLSQQPKAVQEALKNAPFDTVGNDWYGRDLLNMAETFAGTGRDAGKNPVAGSKLLNELGIAGIKYKDGKSRGGDKGTSNFVVFDPTDVKILERNNQPISRKELLQEQIDKLAQ